VLKRIHVRYTLRVPPDADRSVIDRVLGFHAEGCPVARSIAGAIAVSTEVAVVEG
jgi:uncharacterized OsmC-like protein